ncbi:DUF4101 domain-containing protein [Anabaena sp. FACHB-1237]|nr:DUF4101 domain-containing protein [Anabaena sp. FACHB-1237]
MRIALDYYRILGLPLAASEEQLHQAYSDRIVQLPRREYSSAAINSRKQLIEKAYRVLSDHQQRKSYDQIYLSYIYQPHPDHPPDQDTNNLTIQITRDQLVGALLILQELGEYELVLQLGRPYLAKKPSSVPVKTGHHHSVRELEKHHDLPDIILTVALACLELGREQWQQGHYENAAISLETGEELLAKETLFPTVRAEMTADIYKLRPYRILELLALPTTQTAERSQGLELLQSILQDRGGIDGTDNDHSGLNIDDFLRFIQQIRHYLTVAEQHKIFESESKRPSPVATYLAVYALIARGFVQRQPALIRQAKQLLTRLGKRQDVHLEQSLCALLLGQTEEATRVLELSQEYEALAVIREKSQDAPDLLPGLCLYTEQWLQQEVFPHFRDLVKQKAALKDYFADQQVQAYLESLPTDAQNTDEWSVINHQSFPQPDVSYAHYNYQRSNQTNLEPHYQRQFEYHHQNTSTTSEIPVKPSQRVKVNHRTNYYHPTTKSHPLGTGKAHRPRSRRKSFLQKGKELILAYGKSSNRLLQRLDAKTRLAWIVFLFLTGVLVTVLLLSTTFGWAKNTLFSGVDLKGQQLQISLDKPVIDIPYPRTQAKPRNRELTNEIATQVVRSWLNTKAQALGQNHDTSGLGKILTGQVLTKWQGVVKEEAANNSYRVYEHSVEVESLNQKSADNVIVEAKVRESTEFYENGVKQRNSDENLRVRYDLIREGDSWIIQGMSVVQSNVD